MENKAKFKTEDGKLKAEDSRKKCKTKPILRRRTEDRRQKKK